MLPTKGRLCERPLETRAKTFYKSFIKTVPSAYKGCLPSRDCGQRVFPPPYGGKTQNLIAQLAGCREGSVYLWYIGREQAPALRITKKQRNNQIKLTAVRKAREQVYDFFRRNVGEKNALR